MKRLLILLFGAALFSGCSSSVLPPVTVVEETPAAASIADSPAPLSPQEGYSVEELDGVAGLYDPLPMHETFEDAYSANPHTIGWINIENTVIDYPVLRTTDNDFYLTHDAEGNDSKYGAIFMDFRNAVPSMQQHIIIYGHNMKNGTMFHDLVNYKQQDFFQQNRRIYLLWDGMDTEWEIFCAYIVEPDTIYPIQTSFEDENAFASAMNDSIKYAQTVTPSVVDGTVSIQPSDQVLSLITCTYEYDDSRYVVMARRVK